MRVLKNPEDWAGGSTAVTIGNFDGVHRGHQAILERLGVLCREVGAKARLVLSFDPHPATVVRPDSAPLQLVTPGQKEELLAAYGADVLLRHPFDAVVAALPPESFVSRTLVRDLKAAAVVVGEGFRFGRHRAGDVALLRQLGEAHGFRVEAVGPVLEGDTVISSSRIREAVSSGWIETANAMLGRAYCLVGACVAGASRGRSLGFPTANLQPENELLPGRGVYITEVVLEGEDDVHPAVTNIGVRPTFREPGLSIESHLLSFEGNLRGRGLRLYFHKRIRGERKFSGPEALVRQIREDVSTAESWFAAREP